MPKLAYLDRERLAPPRPPVPLRGESQSQVSSGSLERAGSSRGPLGRSQGGSHARCPCSVPPGRERDAASQLLHHVDTARPDLSALTVAPCVLGRGPFGCVTAGKSGRVPGLGAPARLRGAALVSCVAPRRPARVWPGSGRGVSVPERSPEPAHRRRSGTGPAAGRACAPWSLHLGFCATGSSQFQVWAGVTEGRSPPFSTRQAPPVLLCSAGTCRVCLVLSTSPLGVQRATGVGDCARFPVQQGTWDPTRALTTDRQVSVW